MGSNCEKESEKVSAAETKNSPRTHLLGNPSLLSRQSFGVGLVRLARLVVGLGFQRWTILIAVGSLATRRTVLENVGVKSSYSEGERTNLLLGKLDTNGKRMRYDSDVNVNIHLKTEELSESLLERTLKDGVKHLVSGRSGGPNQLSHTLLVVRDLLNIGIRDLSRRFNDLVEILDQESESVKDTHLLATFSHCLLFGDCPSFLLGLALLGARCLMIVDGSSNVAHSRDRHLERGAERNKVGDDLANQVKGLFHAVLVDESFLVLEERSL